MAEIKNRVSESKLITFDLEDLYPEGKRELLDIKDWLHEGLILREKEFRTYVANHNWANYKDTYVALYCSVDAIIPAWAYMLITTYLNAYAFKIVIGNLEQLEGAIYQSILEELDVASFKDKSVIIKGCSNKPIPENAYIWATIKVQSVAKSVMYGEACSAVPLFKQK